MLCNTSSSMSTFNPNIFLFYFILFYFLSVGDGKFKNLVSTYLSNPCSTICQPHLTLNVFGKTIPIALSTWLYSCKSPYVITTLILVRKCLSISLGATTLNTYRNIHAC